MRIDASYMNCDKGSEQFLSDLLALFFVGDALRGDKL